MERSGVIMAIEANELFFRYNKKQPWILENVSLTLERGECVALLAPSGFGKTTLAKLLSGYLTAQKGEVLCDGKPLPKKGLCPVQMIFQHPENAVDPRQKMHIAIEESGGCDNELLKKLGIENEWLNRFPHELSGGELQRICVARALMCGANYIICDEISTMLDAITQAQIWNAVLEEAHKRQLGILVFTHNTHLAERIATRTITEKTISEAPLF